MARDFLECFNVFPNQSTESFTQKYWLTENRGWKQKSGHNNTELAGFFHALHHLLLPRYRWKTVAQTSVYDRPTPPTPQDFSPSCFVHCQCTQILIYSRHQWEWSSQISVNLFNSTGCILNASLAMSLWRSSFNFPCMVSKFCLL